MNAVRVNIDKPYSVGKGLEVVKVSPVGDFSDEPWPAIKVYVTNVGGTWKIANMVYATDPPFDLKGYLQDGLGKKGGFQGEDPDTMLSVKEMLLGTWEHVSTSKSPDGPTRPLGDIDISWTFRADGTGTYSQQVSPSSKMRSRDMKWTLDGNTIILGGRTKYTIVKKGEAKMIWRNELLGDYYHVEKS